MKEYKSNNSGIGLKAGATDSVLRVILNSSPYITVLFDSGFQVIDCNPAALSFLGFETEAEMLAGFYERISNGIPENQSSGRQSISLIDRFVTTVKEGRCKFETELMLNGEVRTLAADLIKIPHGGDFAIVAYVIDMTEYYNREHEIIKTREINELQLAKLQLVVKGTKIGLWDMEVMQNDPVNPDNIFNWSDEFRHMLGYNDEHDFPNVLSSWSNLLHQDDKERVLSLFKAHLLDKTGNTPYDIEYRIWKKDGKPAYFRASGETIRDDAGNAIRVAGALMDITESKQMTEALNEAIVGLKNNQGKLYALNNAASTLLNSDPETFDDALQKSMKMIVDALKINRTYIWRNYVEDGQLCCRQLYEYCNGAEPQQGRDHARGMPYSGNISRWEKTLSEGGCINNIVRDMPQEEQSLFIDNCIVSILVEPVFINGEFWGFVGFDDCFDEREFSQEDESILRSCSVIFGNAWLRNEMFASLRDTSIQLESALAQAKAANKAKSDFLSTVSHEIRTPMNAILGITEIQLQRDTLSHDIREAFDKIYVSGDLLLGIINDILDLSKIEAGKLELIIDKYEISSLISDTVQLNLMRIGSKQIEFKLDIDENIPVLLSGDELRIKQILNNLLSNAFKYTEEGTVSLSVSMEAGNPASDSQSRTQPDFAKDIADNQYSENSGDIQPLSDSTDCSDDNDNIIIVFRISDTGQGMSDKHIEKLFDEYSRFNLESNRTIEGTGLGMSIVSNLLRLMNGEISIESELGKGSVFTVRLPQIRAAQSTLGKESAENLGKFGFSGGSSMKRVQITRTPMPYGSVLIVDDVETNIYVARGLLIPYGLKIDSAESGFEAIEKVKNGNVYDVIFMDHMMPKMDGIEATRTIKSMGYQHPIVALTANAVIGQADMFLSNGFDDFIAKPIDLRQLNATLNKYIKDKYAGEAHLLEQAEKDETAQTHQDEEAAPHKDALYPVNQRIIDAFVRDAEKAITVVEATINKPGPLTEQDYRAYDTCVHGMKSALAIIGKMELSAAAYNLEMSVYRGKNEFLVAETIEFLASLRAVVEECSRTEDCLSGESAVDDQLYLCEQLLVIKAACEEYDARFADDTLAQLRERAWSQPTQKLLEKIASHLLHSDFDDVIDIVNKRIEEL